MLSLGFIALGAAVSIAVIVWALLYREYKKIKLQEKIKHIRQRIREREEDSGNESDGDAEWLDGDEEWLVTLLSSSKLDQGNWV
ncbi:viral protein U [Human immunodeficiency virus 1]|uniref:Protein Vpu n=1 Tax=Human immunodeficiency virus type 1 group N (isolate YBF30) TaxID=388818 RepID=VPU_HV1YF|nr:RecName: Full=Protein Vpu; AltName: Full=U ORF protein; AltName: Full=Viral protein U [HIV-1 N_YBF30]CAA06815.1 viral protein U [Human immunodeficiency virus 1]